MHELTRQGKLPPAAIEPTLYGKEFQPLSQPNPLPVVTNQPHPTPYTVQWTSCHMIAEGHALKANVIFKFCV